MAEDAGHVPDAAELALLAAAQFVVIEAVARLDAGDIEGALELYTDDFLLEGANGTVARGKGSASGLDHAQLSSRFGATGLPRGEQRPGLRRRRRGNCRHHAGFVPAREPSPIPRESRSTTCAISCRSRPRATFGSSGSKSRHTN